MQETRNLTSTSLTAKDAAQSLGELPVPLDVERKDFATEDPFEYMICSDVMGRISLRKVYLEENDSF